MGWVSVSGLPCEGVPVDTCTYSLRSAVIDTAASYYYVRETNGYNRSPEIDRFNTRAGVPLRSSWCMAYAFSMWDLACKAFGTVNRFDRTGGVARQLKHAKKIVSGLKVVYLNPKILSTLELPEATMLCRRNGGGTERDIGLLWLGHVALKRDGENHYPHVLTWEGNTSAGSVGSQRDGDGVAKKKRLLSWFLAGIVHPETIVRKPCDSTITKQ